MIILIVFILLILMLGLGFLTDDAAYPETVYGLTRFEAFAMAGGFVLVISCIPMGIDILLLIISLIKIHQIRKRQGA